MKSVQPIRDKNKIEEMKNELFQRDYKYYMLFTIGINTGLRISDLLSLKVKHVRNSHINIVEKKTKKVNRFFINPMLLQDIDRYIAGKDDEEYLFKGKTVDKDGNQQPITRSMAWHVLNKAADRIGLGDIGCHSLRKTFGYWHYKTHKDIAILQQIFNHSSPSITLMYIGINQDIMDNTVKNFYL